MPGSRPVSSIQVLRLRNGTFALETWLCYSVQKIGKGIAVQLLGTLRDTITARFSDAKSMMKTGAGVFSWKSCL